MWSLNEYGYIVSISFFVFCFSGGGFYGVIKVVFEKYME